MSRIVEIENINAGYGPLDVLFSLSLPVAQGRITAVLGPNGAGKTTTLKVAAGLIKPSSGSVRLNGHEIGGKAPRDIARQGLCLIPEGRGIFPSLTVRENLILQSKITNSKLSTVEEIAYAQFPVLGQRRKQISGTLSGGEQQMLALSRALTSQSKVIFIDEISMGLAPNLVERLFQVIADLAQQGHTIVLVEQLAEFAMEIADYVAVLAQGKLAAMGQPADVSELLNDLYLGADDDAKPAEHPTVRSDTQGLWMTPNGTLTHHGDCVVVTGRTDVRHPDSELELRSCDLCAPADAGTAAA